MKRFIGILAAVAIVLVVASPVLAASLGISPSHTELEVPGDGSATADFQVHYFSGDLQITLEDIPLRVEPETMPVEPSGEPVDIQITIYGDESLGSRVYDGYVKFLGMTSSTRRGHEPAGNQSAGNRSTRRGCVIRISFDESHWK